MLNTNSPSVDYLLFGWTAAFIAAFCLLALIDIQQLSDWVDIGFNWSIQWFGLYWQLLLLVNFVIGIGICFLKGSKTQLGGTQTEFSLFQWGSMIMCTLLAGGGVFWAAGEPIAYFLSTPPLFANELAIESKTLQASYPALAQAYLHWGFLAWAILGSLATILLMYYHYNKGLPLAPRTLLYPVFGDKAIHGVIGNIADICSIIAVVAGTVGPIGFFALQVSYGLGELTAINDGMITRTIMLITLMCIYVVSAITGLSRGIQILSRFNIILGLGLLTFIVILGPTWFIFEAFFNSMGFYLTHIVDMALYRGDTDWLSWWTLFFWGWFIGYAPLMAIFIARISKGRSVRSIIIMLSIIAPIVTNFWFTIIGGSGIAFELGTPNVIASTFEGFNLPAALLAMTQQLPLGYLISILFLLLTTIFVATTGDSMTYVVSVCMSKKDQPMLWVRVFWGVTMGLMAWILINLGDGSVGISKLQSFIVITAVPVSIIILPTLWDAIKIVRSFHNLS